MENTHRIIERLAHRIILLVRGQQVILDSDLATLYGVTTKRLNEQIKRNRDRFPPDFLFQLSNAEKLEVVANCDHLTNLKFSRTNPYAFTEHGIIMAASILSSQRAIEISVLVIRAFVKLRQMLDKHTELRHKFTELESRLDNHDQTIQALISTIQQLIEHPPSSEKHPIGFAPWAKEKDEQT